MSLSLVPTYGAWLTSLFVETILYGIGFLQVWLYFPWWPKDDRSVKLAVVFVMFFETTQITFFFRSTFFRFVLKFGEIQEDLLWSDSLQLLANVRRLRAYLSAFTVQMCVPTFFSRWDIDVVQIFRERIYRRHAQDFYTTSTLGIYLVVLFALVQISAGIAQTILSYKLRSFAKLEETKAITTLQNRRVARVRYRHHSLPLRLPVAQQKWATADRSNDEHIDDERGQSRDAHRYLFGTHHDTRTSSSIRARFGFFLSLAPNSKLYMNSMLATLNMRQHVDFHTSRNTARVSISAVEFVKPSSPEESVDLAEKTSPVDSTGCDSSANEKMD
ncbi:hypothetical protein B0H11DRAFT_2222848 [Mycena galericulata]|nr:hypothetical protein B0H11DRAFT_2222848 [Mycena galericulata]